MHKNILFSAILVVGLGSCSKHDNEEAFCRQELEGIGSYTNHVTDSSNSIVVDSSYDEDSALLVADGKIDDGYWAGVIEGDYVEVDLGGVKQVERIELTIKRIEFASTTELYRMLVSNDGVDWKYTLTTLLSSFKGDRAYSCARAGATNETIYCNLDDNNPGFRYIRFEYITPYQEKILSLGVKEISVFGVSSETRVIEVCD